MDCPKKDLAKILEPSQENIKLCADRIKSGEIVGIPTETVYGLAASALNPEAIKKIFVYKGRPLSDPIIIHVSNLKMCEDLVDIDEKTQKLFEYLTSVFWPGPLTIVLKASEKVDSILNANTGFIGLRFPNNEITQRLIDLAGPIGAPSANKFCHISPVNPLHVYEDFKEFDVCILDGGVSSCSMESTVLKPDCENKRVEILRRGFLSKSDLEEKIKACDTFRDFEVDYKYKEKKPGDSGFFLVRRESKENEPTKTNTESSHVDIDENQEAPGQFLKHYSPLIDAYIVDTYNTSRLNISKNDLHRVVVLDFNGKLAQKYGNVFGFSKDLSVNGSDTEVIKNLYDFLHWTEQCENMEKLLICDICNYIDDINSKHYETIRDRLEKVSSSRRITIIDS